MEQVADGKGALSEKLELPNLGHKKLLRERVYEVLRDRILNNSLSPGFRLIEEELADNLNVSRTPVREAIQRLEIEGLVTASSGRGYEVAPIAAHDIEDALDLRSVLEVYAAERAALLATPEQIDRLRKLCAEEQAALQGDLSRAVGKIQEINRQIHDTVIECADNTMLSSVIQYVQGHPAYKLFALGEAKNLRRFAESHCRLVQAIENRDPQAARDVFTFHRDLSREIFIRSQTT